MMGCRKLSHVGTRELSLLLSFKMRCAIWSGSSDSPFANGPLGLRRIFRMSGPKYSRMMTWPSFSCVR